jgi:hypothetical protein
MGRGPAGNGSAASGTPLLSARALLEMGGGQCLLAYRLRHGAPEVPRSFLPRDLMAARPLFRNPNRPLSVLREKGSSCLIHVETFHRDAPILITRDSRGPASDALAFVNSRTNSGGLALRQARLGPRLREVHVPADTPGHIRFVRAYTLSSDGGTRMHESPDRKSMQQPGLVRDSDQRAEAHGLPRGRLHVERAVWASLCHYGCRPRSVELALRPWNAV